MDEIDSVALNVDLIPCKEDPANPAKKCKTTEPGYDLDQYKADMI